MSDIFETLTTNFKSFERTHNNKLIVSPELLGKELSENFNVYRYQKYIIIRTGETSNIIIENKKECNAFYFILKQLFGEDVALDYSLYCNLDDRIISKIKVALNYHLEIINSRYLTREDEHYMKMMSMKKCEKIPEGIMEYFSNIGFDKVSIKVPDLKKLFREKFNYVAPNERAFGNMVRECCHIYNLRFIRWYGHGFMCYDIVKKEEEKILNK